MSNTTIAMIVVACLVLAILGFALMWKKVPQDKALVITGLKKRVITGGGGIVIPLLERSDAISLENMKIEVSVSDSLTKQGVELSADGVAVIKVKSEKESILNALEQFNTGRVDSTIQNIKDTVKDVLEGKLREVLSCLDVEEVYKNRENFASEVQSATVSDLGAMGIEIKAFTIREINDRNGYLNALGAERIAAVKRDAAIAQAEAEKETKIKKAEAERLGQVAQLEAQTKISEAVKEKELQESHFKKESQAAKAEADMAYQIKENVISQEAIKTKMEAALIQKDKDTELASKEALRRQAELVADVEKRAEAEKFKVIQEAEAQKAREIAQAEAEARRVELASKAEADAIRQKGQAQAESIRLIGEAEAEAMQKRAEAFKEYGEAAMTQMIIEKLPEIAGAIASPLAQTEKIVIVDNGNGSEGNSGAAKVSGYVGDIMSQLPEIMQTLTGFDMMDTLTKSMTKTNSINTTVHANGEVQATGDATKTDLTQF